MNKGKNLIAMRRIVFVLLATFLPLMASAQKLKVVGEVVDDQNNPVIGASVFEKGTTNGAVTDLDGQFTIQVEKGATLQFSYIGYVGQSAKAASQMKVVLKEDNNLLDEVVAIGYGSVKRKDVTTAVSSVSTKDLEKVRAKVPDAAVVTGALAIWGGSAQYEGRTTSCAGNGVLPDYAKVQDPKLKYGRYINDVDVRQERKVCVIGHRIYENLFPEGGDPCGKFIEMAGTYFQVVGMDTNDGGINLNGSSSEMVVVPISAIQKIYGRGDSIDFMCFVAKEGVKIKDILERAGQVLCREHYIDPSDKKAMGSINLEEMFSIMDSLFKGVNILIWLVGFGTLLAASIGVSNIMMVTVKERTTEIGIRRAIGATPRMILSQIMMESVILTLIFGLFGIVVSVFLLTGAEYIVAMTGSHVAFQISFSSAMLALLIILVLGVLAGLAPASRAMSIRPVDAMRDE